MSSPSRNPLEALADEFSARVRNGSHPTIDEYAEAHPELAADIRALFPMLNVLERIASESADGRSTGLRDQHEGKKIGDFRLLRMIGRGGMGIVYEAIQEPLGRRVAVKILPSAGMLDPKFRERFRREARAGAMLHHTNIVPIFDFGECDGVYYYAMQYIDGRSLDEVLLELRRIDRRRSLAPGISNTSAAPDAATQWVARTIVDGIYADSSATLAVSDDPAVQRVAAGTSTERAIRPTRWYPPTRRRRSDTSGSSSTNSTAYWRSVARIGLQVADALASAHSHGILHRDIKPANLLLDTAGTVWITDFGLAKADSEHRLTRTGDIVGTLRYMAPESLSGDSEARSDVYALGLTLYEMVALEPAYQDVDRGRLIQSILTSSPKPLSKIRPEAPRDLAVLIHKAISRRPDDRYASAEDLADDLRRFIKNEPIRARQLSLPIRLVRWARRNPVVTVLSGSLLALMLCGLVFSLALSVWFRDLAAQRQREMHRAQRAELQSLEERVEALLVSQRPGQRLESIRTIRAAVDLARRLKILPDKRLRYRNLAIAALRLPDMDMETSLRTQPLLYEDSAVAFSHDLQEYALTDPQRQAAELHGIPERLPVMALPGVARVRAFDPSGRWLAVSTREAPMDLEIWDRATLSPVLRNVPMQGYGLPFARAAFDAAGARIAVGLRDKTIGIYRLPEGDAILVIPADDLTVSPRFSPDGKYLAVACSAGRRLDIYDCETGRRLHRARLRDEPSAVAWHPLGQQLMVSVGPDMELWDTHPWRKRSALRGHTGRVTHVEYHPLGDILATHAWDQSVRLWEPLTERCLLRLPGRVLRFAESGEQIALLQKTVASVHRCIVSAEFSALRVGNGRPLELFALDQQARWLVANFQEGPIIWDLLHRREVASLPSHQELFVTDADAQWLYSGGESGIARWPLLHQARSELEIGPPEPVAIPGLDPSTSISAVIVRGGRVCCLRDDSAQAIVTELDRKGPPFQLPVPDFAAWPDLSHDGKWLAVGNYHGRTMEVFEVTTGQRLLQLKQPRAFPRFSQNSRWLAVSGGRHVQIIDTQTWDVAAESQPRTIEKGMPFFVNDEIVAAPISDPPGVVLLSVPDAVELATLPADLDTGFGACWGAGPDGRRIVTRDGDAIVGIWNLVALRRSLRELGLDW